MRLIVQKYGYFFGLGADSDLKFLQTGFEADSESKSSDSERIWSQIFWTPPISALDMLRAADES